MGKRNSQPKNVAMLDSDDTDSVSSSSTLRSDTLTVSANEQVQLDKESVLDQCLDSLYEKRGSTRENALVSIIDTFNSSLQHEFVENKFATLLHRCLNSIKKGSSKEIASAAHVIGLLALTTGPGEKAQEILEESIIPISEALKSGSETSKIASLLDCLGIITFVGGVEAEETEKSMNIMWLVIHRKMGSNVVSSKPSAELITAVVSAWSFLLTTIEGLALNPKIWQESIFYLSTLLDKEDRSVRIAAGESLALIFEIGSVEKFNGDDEDTLMNSRHILGLRAKVLNQVRSLSVEAGGKGSAKKDLNSQRNTFKDIQEFLEDGHTPELTMKIGGESFSTSSWFQLIQLNFLKRFLGGGFVKHMQENEFLHTVFGFTPKSKAASGIDRISVTDKRKYKSPNSVQNKARTQLLNKQRMLSQDRNYAAAMDDNM